MKLVKEEKGRCQAAVPADATIIMPDMAQGPNSSYTVNLNYDSDRYKVQTDAELKEWHYSKAFENSPTRQIVERESHAVSPGFRTIHVYLPLERGRCHAGVNFKTSVPEETMLRIAKSATLSK
jgi:hypothetical protein